jgi:hypothetical protein
VDVNKPILIGNIDFNTRRAGKLFEESLGNNVSQYWKSSRYISLAMKEKNTVFG